MASLLTPIRADRDKLIEGRRSSGQASKSTTAESGSTSLGARYATMQLVGGLLQMATLSDYVRDVDLSKEFVSTRSVTLTIGVPDDCDGSFPGLPEDAEFSITFRVWPEGPQPESDLLIEVFTDAPIAEKALRGHVGEYFHNGSPKHIRFVRRSPKRREAAFQQLHSFEAMLVGVLKDAGRAIAA